MAMLVKWKKAATQTNKIFAIAGLSVTGDEQTTLSIEKVVSSNG